MNQIIYVRQAPQFFETEGPVMHHQAFRTSVIDLTRGTEQPPVGQGDQVRVPRRVGCALRQ